MYKSNNILENDIFFMKHNLEYRRCVEQLIGLRIKTFINLTYREVMGMIYIHEHMRMFSLSYHMIDSNSKQILKSIKRNSLFYFYLGIF